jgi:hypothetical protein
MIRKMVMVVRSADYKKIVVTAISDPAKTGFLFGKLIFY